MEVNLEEKCCKHTSTRARSESVATSQCYDALRMWLINSTAILSLMLLPQGNMLAQTGNPTSQVDTGGSVVLNGVINAAARHSTDLGRVETTTSLSQMTLVFKRTPAQHTALEQLLQEQQDPSSPNYHRWLTPEEFADLFAPSVADINRITTWLQSEGLTVKTIARGRSWLVFTRNVAQVQNCFHTGNPRYKEAQSN